MIPPEFDYAVAESVDDALAKLSAGGEDAKLLAGGHSLVPLMKLRLAAPTLLVDIGRIDALRGVQRENGGWRIGAMTRHVDLQQNGELGIVARAASLIADQQVRNRGTIGGSLAHADPASDLPAVVLALDGTLVAAKAGGVTREIAAGDFFVDYLTTSLGEDELVTEIRIADRDWSYGYEKFTRRAEDWAMVGVVALVKRAADGSCEDLRVGLTNMGSTPLRATATEDALRGQSLDDASISAAAQQAAEGTEPAGDLNATSDYKRHLARVLTARALRQAAAA